MKKKTIDIKAGRLFPFHFLVLGGIFLAAGLGVIAVYPITATILILLSLLILTAYEGTEINADAHTFREYYSFLFQKSGRVRKYGNIERISIHAVKVTQRMFAPRTSHSSTYVHVAYHAYLRLSGDEKIFLFSRKNKRDVLEEAQKIAGMLNTSVVDYAVGR